MPQDDLIFHDIASNPDVHRRGRFTVKLWVNDASIESICGSDERKKVTGTTAMPYKAICHLQMKSSVGDDWIGTGWLTHSNKLYTAGHCVFDHDEGGWFESILVVPGKAGSSEPFGRYRAIAVATTRGWHESREKRYDMGAIKLVSDVSHSDFLTPTIADADTATVCGYPTDRDAGQFQYKMRDNVKKKSGRFWYQIDTWGGQSGGPLLQNNEKAFGIHNYGGCDNSGSDLYQKFLDAIESW